MMGEICHWSSDFLQTAMSFWLSDSKITSLIPRLDASTWVSLKAKDSTCRGDKPGKIFVVPDLTKPWSSLRITPIEHKYLVSSKLQRRESC